MVRLKHTQNSSPKTPWVVAVALTSILVSACSPGFQSTNKLLGTQNQTTGFVALDGKQHTGASNDQELAKAKAEVIGKEVTSKADLQAVADEQIESLPKGDRLLAMRVLSARVTSDGNETLLHTMIREIGKVTFTFSPKEIIAKTSSDGPNDVRFEAVVGKTESGDTTTFEAAMLCRKPAPIEGKAPYTACRVATVKIKDKSGTGAKAAVVVRNQETLIMAKTTTVLKHAVLERLFTKFRTAQPGLLQSFEVAWGASGFALSMGDPEVCPIGRLVETNDLDEPLRLNCTGVPEFHDLEGHMVGNSTHGEVFLAIAATIPGLFWGESNERLYLYVRQKREPKKTAPTVTTPPATTPATPATPNAPGPKPVTPSGPVVNPPAKPPVQPTVPSGQLDEDEEDTEDGEPIFDTDIQASVTPPNASTSTGWLIPINYNDPITKTWARDRKDPAISARVEIWKTKRRKDIESFATYFPPNQVLVSRKLAESRIPAEFALIMVGESPFFKTDGYKPVKSGGGSTAYGPWQMINGTAIANGLKIYPGKASSRVCDERGDLAKSSAAAGRYLRKISDMFPYDPKIVILGYNQGEGHADKSVKKLKNSTAERLKVIQEMGISFWAIRKFNMSNASGIKYVEDFVSLYHAVLEMPRIAPAKAVAPWTPKCG